MRTRLQQNKMISITDRKTSQAGDSQLASKKYEFVLASQNILGDDCNPFQFVQVGIAANYLSIEHALLPR